MRNYKYRCQAIVYNKSKKRNYRCNNGIYRYVNNKQYCWCHYNNYTRDSIIMIQSAYRGYKCRRYLKIYKKLPDDIQIIIKRKISSEFYYKKYCNSIYKILYKRYQNMNRVLDEKQLTYKILYNNSAVDLGIDFVTAFIEYIYPTYYIYNKYFDIISTSENDSMLTDIKNLHILSYPILNIVRTLSQDYFYDNENSSIDRIIYNKFVNSIFIINSLSEKYESFEISPINPS